MGMLSRPENTLKASSGTEYGKGPDGYQYGFHQETCKTSEELAEFNAKMVSNIKEQQYDVISQGSKGDDVWIYYKRPDTPGRLDE